MLKNNHTFNFTAILFISLMFIYPTVSAFSVDIPQDVIRIGANYSINTNYSDNSGALEGRNTNALYTYFKGLFDAVYCKLTGCTIDGDITADHFIGDGSQLTNVNYGLYESFADGASITNYYNIASIPITEQDQNLLLSVEARTDSNTTTSTLLNIAIATKTTSNTSTNPSITSTTAHSFSSDVTTENGFVIRNARISQNATHWNLDIQKYKATTIYFRVIPLTNTNYTFSTGNLTARAAGTPTETTALTQGFAGDNVIATTTSGNAASATYATYLGNGGSTLSDNNDKTGTWEYFGSYSMSYSSSYLGGHSGNVIVYLNEESRNKSLANQLESIELDIALTLNSFASSTIFNTNVPSIDIKVKGNTTLTGDDFACLTYSNTTATKVIRCYVKLKDTDTHYTVMAIDKYGLRYTTTGTKTVDTGFAYASNSAVVVSLPTPSQGSVVYGNKVDIPIDMSNYITNSTFYEMWNNTKEPTGFTEQGVFGSYFVLDNSNRNFSICANTSYDMYYKGNKITKTSCDSVTLDASAGYTNYIYFDGTDGRTLATSLTPWGNNFANNIQVATVFWNGTIGLIGKERHGITMDSATHYLLHTTVGTRYVSGLTGTFTNPASWSLTNGTIADEDNIDTNIEQTRANLFYHTATGRYTFLYNQSNLFVFDGSNKLMYDNLAGLSEVDNNAYMAMWVVQTVDRDIPTYVIVGQRQDTNIANARANNNFSALSLGALDVPEYKLLYRVILRRDGTSTPVVAEVQDLRSVSNLPSGTYVASSHSALTGLTNDDHPQYLLVDGSRNQTEIVVTNNVTAQNGFFNYLGSLTRKITNIFATNISVDNLQINNLGNVACNPSCGNFCRNNTATYYNATAGC